MSQLPRPQAPGTKDPGPTALPASQAKSKALSPQQEVHAKAKERYETLRRKKTHTS